MSPTQKDAHLLSLDNTLLAKKVAELQEKLDAATSENAGLKLENADAKQQVIKECSFDEAHQVASSKRYKIMHNTFKFA